MKRVLVTGASRGIGFAITRQLAANGWHVVATARTCTPDLEQIISRNPSVEFIAADLSTATGVRELARTARLVDGIDALVANAGIGTEGLLTLMSDDAVQHCVQVNLVAPMLLAREAIKGMLTSGGSLVFVSSVAARIGLSGLSVYSATKGALVSFSRSIAREYGERCVRSNCILPGFVETAMSATLNADDQARIKRRTTLKRLGTVDEIASAVVYLLSPNARYITGTELVIDGGMTA